MQLFSLYLSFEFSVHLPHSHEKLGHFGGVLYRTSLLAKLDFFGSLSPCSPLLGHILIYLHRFGDCKWSLKYWRLQFTLTVMSIQSIATLFFSPTVPCILIVSKSLKLCPPWDSSWLKQILFFHLSLCFSQHWLALIIIASVDYAVVCKLFWRKLHCSCFCSASSLSVIFKLRSFIFSIIPVLFTLSHLIKILSFNSENLSSFLSTTVAVNFHGVTEP